MDAARRTNQLDLCLICGTPVEPLLDFGLLPLAGAFYPPGDPRGQERYPLRLVRCPGCTFMQVGETVPPEVLYRHYSYHSSSSPSLVQHFKALATELEPMLQERSDGLLVEVGCNDGVLLNNLWARGLRVLGVDPSDVAAAASQLHGWPLINDYLTVEVARRIVQDYGHARVVVAANVMAHTTDLHEFTEALAVLCGARGHVVIEVHYQGSLVAGGQFDAVYHEHVGYYSMRALSTLLHAHGLVIVDYSHISTHGGSIRVRARRARTSEESGMVKALLGVEQAFNVQAFVERSMRTRHVLRDVLYRYHHSGARVVAYGAAGRATVLINWCQLAPWIQYAVDASPRRQGCVVPGTQVLVVSPETFLQHPWPHAVLVTAWNYFDDIRAACGGYPNVFILPLPSTTIV